MTSAATLSCEWPSSEGLAAVRNGVFYMYAHDYDEMRIFRHAGRLVIKYASIHTRKER